MKSKKLLEDDVRKLAYGLCQGLAYFHSLKLSHRDIKPGNIMVDKNGNPVIIDFGAAGSTNIKDGTPKYYAPEQQELLHLGHGMEW